MTDKSGKRKRVEKLLKDGVHVIDSARNVAICPSQRQETGHAPYDPVSPCKQCGRTEVAVQMV